MILQLSNRALLKLSGGDTQTFLQGQLSNDIDGLEEGEVQLNAYCQHQGKIIALLWVMKRDDDFYLSFPSDLAEIITKRLTMFKMMSAVEITDVSNELIQLGVIDEGFDNAFKLNDQQSVALVENVDGVELDNESEWALACIANSVAEVELKTSEKFVPQLLNLDIDEVGVNFTKGCYPGQEVVARLHYLGKSKRRMRQFECEGEVNVGDELLVAGSKSAKASGIVVRRVKLGDKSSFLATVEVAFEDAAITLNNADGIQLTRIKND
ncbi:Folate-dependent protein for Fe/S cluster synthesis/repair in oxidative stress [hydrothermal vent metagenome]|uniref:Folate-dependent protein for Fe/S cluster synthesis/repair in oxidative stress n=1 Tax=hydrothermal vent metagenome TaxID=652676 RepID=A0A1W1DEX6_9ZZZZ